MENVLLYRLQTVTMMSWKILIWTFCVKQLAHYSTCEEVIISKFGAKMSYVNSWVTNCPRVDRDQVQQIIGITLSDCVVECGLRQHCMALSYHSQISRCLLLRNTTTELSMDSEQCIFILKSDMIIHQLPCNEDCPSWKTCDVTTGTCKSKECPFPNPINAKVLGNSVSVGSKLRYKSNKGMKEINNLFTGTCLENGTWSYVAMFQLEQNETETESIIVKSKINKNPNETETERDSIPVQNSVTTDGYCSGSSENGNFETSIYNYTSSSGKPLTLRCDMSSNTNNGWIVIQRRVNASDFYKTWEEYKHGFGDLNGNFWLGNENLRTLTKTGSWNIKFELECENEHGFAEFRSFSIGNETTNYTLHVGEYIGGNINDSFSVHNGSQFATKDRDGIKCTRNSHGAWWYISQYHCHDSNLNGLYGSTNFGRGIIWNKWKGYQTSMTATQMKIRRID